MAKDPAFLFYPNDWLGGTMGMTFEEKGAYMELLMMQFNRGHMTTHMIRQIVGQVWDKIKDKFIQDDKGLWYNTRLEEEKNKRQNYTKSRNNNRSGKNQYTKNDLINDTNIRSYDQSLSNHMENENENVNDNIIINKSKKFLFSDFNGLPSHFVETAQRQIKSFQDVSVNPDKVAEIWEIFKMQNLLGDKYYNSENDVYKHFISWLKFSKLDKPKQNETRDRGQEILNWLNSTK